MRPGLSNTLSIVATVACIVSAAVGAPAPAGRMHIRIDDNWRFMPDTAAAQVGDQITDWKVQPATGFRGINVDAIPESLDKSPTSWRTARVGDDQFGGRYGHAWFRAELRDTKTLPEGAHRSIHFASVDDNCVVFLNGKKLVSHEGWDDEFDVDLTPAWKIAGPNELTLLVENTGGGGGIMKPATYSAVRQSAADNGPVRADFNDSNWRTVHLPHDYVVEGKFDPKQDASHGSLAAGAAWYRKRLEIPAADEGKSVRLEFDGIYRDAVVYLNGKEIAHQPSGYIGFGVDITKSLHFGSTNMIAVHVNAHKQEGWWYEGGGIYRHVWLTETDPVHVAPYGIHVQSEVQGPETDANPPANIKIQTRVVNEILSGAKRRFGFNCEGAGWKNGLYHIDARCDSGRG